MRAALLRRRIIFIFNLPLILLCSSFLDAVSPEQEAYERYEHDSTYDSSSYGSDVRLGGFWRRTRVGYADHVGALVAALRNERADVAGGTRGTCRCFWSAFDTAAEDGPHCRFSLSFLLDVCVVECRRCRLSSRSFLRVAECIHVQSVQSPRQEAKSQTEYKRATVVISWSGGECDEVQMSEVRGQSLLS